MSLDVYSEANYKSSIKLRLKELQPQRRGLTLKRIARQIPIQYTYLSKALNDEKTHLSEDHLYVIGQILEFLPEELEFLSLQRAHDVSQNPQRKKSLFNRLEKLKRARNLNVDVKATSSSTLNQEMAYLFNPLCILVHVALSIDEIRKNPNLLLSRLGINSHQLKEVLSILERNDFIEIDEDGRVIKTKQSHFHFGRDHQLMRVHQNILKSAINAHLNRTEEQNKHSFLVTFTMDPQGFEKIKEEFHVFLKKVEQVARSSRDENLYQLSFDLFRWL